MRTGISVTVTEGDRERLLAIIANRNSLQKHVWRARIVLITAEGHALRVREVAARIGSEPLRVRISRQWLDTDRRTRTK